MIEIKKGPEPKELLQYRKQKFSSYSDMPSNVKQKVLSSLLSEQGHLCAYCMGRIGERDDRHPATIEHFIPQGISKDGQLNYKNMAAVCCGNRDARSNNDKTCDAKRGSLPLTQQEMKKLNIFDGRTLSTIQYRADGTIFSSDPDADEDLNKRLNLNCEARQLKECRRAALRALHTRIKKKYPSASAPDAYFRGLLAHYQQPGDPKAPYAGILIDWLKRRI